MNSKPSLGVSLRKHFWLAIIIVITIVVLLFGSGWLQALLHRAFSLLPGSQPQSDVFQAATCPFLPTSAAVPNPEIKCGYLTVPENRSKPQGPTIKLAIAIYKAPVQAPGAAPIVWLNGGPGGETIAPMIMTNPVGIVRQLSDHDLILLDQRGTGYSQPSLGCPEVIQAEENMLGRSLSNSEQLQLASQATQTCYNRLVKEGVDLNSYNTLEDAQDVHALIKSLGYKQVILYGNSYGTRLALTVMRLFPQDVQSAVLDSVYPPQETRISMTRDVAHAFETFFQGCNSNAFCHRFYPDVQAKFSSLVSRFDKQPVTIQGTGLPSTGKTYPVVVHGDDLVRLLFNALYATYIIGVLPSMIFLAYHGDYTLLQRIYNQTSLTVVPAISTGTYNSTTCSEDWAYTTPKELAQASLALPSQERSAITSILEYEVTTCRIWRVQPVPAAQKLPVKSSIPTLVLSGQYDPITPPAFGMETVRTLSRGVFFQFPGVGHGVRDLPCGMQIIHEFEDHPDQRPDSSCIATLNLPSYV